MNLKEAFHYQNTLGEMLSAATMYLIDPGNMTTVTQTHMRRAVNPEAEDETIDVTPDRPYPCENNMIINLYLELLNERERLAVAIQTAKEKCPFKIDPALSTNRLRQTAAQTLQRLVRMKPGERKTSAASYKFNVEGNQTTYRYDVNEVTNIDFDRNFVKKIVTMLQGTANEVSKEADRCMVEVELEGFEPEFDMDGTFDDAVEAFCERTLDEQLRKERAV